MADKREPLTESIIRSVHALVLRRSCPDEPGRYRTVQVFISGSQHVPPNPAAVPAAMGGLVSWLRSAEDGTQPTALAAEFHARLVDIHPFVDGNGRTTRLVANLLLMRSGYLPASWTPEDRTEYSQALEAAHLEGSFNAITRLTARAVTRTFDRYLHVIEQTWKPDLRQSGNGTPANAGSACRPPD